MRKNLVTSIVVAFIFLGLFIFLPSSQVMGSSQQFPRHQFPLPYSHSYLQLKGVPSTCHHGFISSVKYECDYNSLRSWHESLLVCYLPYPVI